MEFRMSVFSIFLLSLSTRTRCTSSREATITAECEHDKFVSMQRENANLETGSCEGKSNVRMAPVSSGKMERTLCIVKPDGIQRSLIGEIIKRFEAKGLKLVALKFFWPKEDMLREHYIQSSNAPFFDDMIKYIKRGPILPMVWEGYHVINIGRSLIHGSDKFNPSPGSIRGDFSSNDFIHRFTVIHCSDSVEEAEREFSLWFNENEIVPWNLTNEIWIYQK